MLSAKKKKKEKNKTKKPSTVKHVLLCVSAGGQQLGVMHGFGLITINIKTTYSEGV